MPKSRDSGGLEGRDPGDESKTMAVPSRRLLRPGKLDAGVFGADVASFRLHLAAENKAERTIRAYTEAVRWFAAAHLLCQNSKTRWEQVDTQDVQRWMVHLLGRYSEAYAYQQYRALQQFFRWLAAEEELPDPMARLRPPKVTQKPVPFFTSVELSKLEKACRGNTFAQRRDAAILAVFRATGVRLAELAGIRYDPDGPGRSDLDMERREIKVRGKGGKDRTVRIHHEAARRVDRYLRVRARHEQAYRLGLWLGTGGRGPLTGNGIYQMVKRRGDQAGVRVYPHRFRHHFSHTWLDRGGAEGDLMELNGWSSPQMLERYGGSVRGARARRHYDLIMRD
jgi:site-specific recombinase XerD